MNKKPTMFEAAKKVMGMMEQLTARQIIVRLKDNGRKEVPTPRQLAQRFRTDQQINVIKSKSIYLWIPVHHNNVPAYWI